MGGNEILVAGGRAVPPCVLHKTVVNAQVGIHRGTAPGAGRKQVGGNLAADLLFNHLADSLFVIVGALVAGNRALEKAEISLHVVEAVLVEASPLKAMADVGGDDKVVFICNQ